MVHGVVILTVINHSKVFSQEPDPKAADGILRTIKDNHRALQSSYNLENSNFYNVEHWQSVNLQMREKWHNSNAPIG